MLATELVRHADPHLYRVLREYEEDYLPHLYPGLSHGDLESLGDDWLAELKRTDEAIASGVRFPHVVGYVEEGELDPNDPEQYEQMEPHIRRYYHELSSSNESETKLTLDRMRNVRAMRNVEFKTTEEGGGHTRRDAFINGESAGYTITGADPVGPEQYSIFSRVIEPGEVVRRFDSIFLNEEHQGQGIGSMMYLDAMAQYDDGKSWFYNSQAWEPAAKTLIRMLNSELIDMYYTANYLVDRDGNGLWNG